MVTPKQAAKELIEDLREQGSWKEIMGGGEGEKKIKEKI